MASMVTDHKVKPYENEGGRIRCKTCGGAVVGTPAGWFHVREN